MSKLFSASSNSSGAPSFKSNDAWNLVKAKGFAAHAGLADLAMTARDQKSLGNSTNLSQVNHHRQCLRYSPKRLNCVDKVCHYRWIMRHPVKARKNTVFSCFFNQHPMITPALLAGFHGTKTQRELLFIRWQQSLHGDIQNAKDRTWYMQVLPQAPALDLQNPAHLESSRYRFHFPAHYHRHPLGFRGHLGSLPPPSEQFFWRLPTSGSGNSQLWYKIWVEKGTIW